jgi:hypothetical protein
MVISLTFNSSIGSNLINKLWLGMFIMPLTHYELLRGGVAPALISATEGQKCCALCLIGPLVLRG